MLTAHILHRRPPFRSTSRRDEDESEDDGDVDDDDDGDDEQSLPPLVLSDDDDDDDDDEDVEAPHAAEEEMHGGNGLFSSSSASLCLLIGISYLHTAVIISKSAASAEGGGGRKSEAFIKSNAMRCDAMDPIWNLPCNCSSSSNPGRCLDYVTMRQLRKERIFVFGLDGQPPPSTKERGEKLTAVLKDRSNLLASIVQEENKQQQQPVVAVRELLVTLLDTVITVCESVYLMIIALANSPSQQKSKKWQACKKAIASAYGKKQDFVMTKADRATKATKHKPKHDHALQWLVQVGEKSSDLSVNAEEENLKIVPYGTVGEMFKEYVYSNQGVILQHITTTSMNLLIVNYLLVYRCITRYLHRRNAFGTCGWAKMSTVCIIPKGALRHAASATSPASIFLPRPGTTSASSKGTFSGGTDGSTSSSKRERASKSRTRRSAV